MFPTPDLEQPQGFSGSGNGEEIRASTRALQQQIEAELARRRRQGLGNANRSVLIAGGFGQPIPAGLISNPVLMPIDKVVWLILHRQGRHEGESTLLPCYRDLARLANVTTKATVHAAVVVLRCTRWLTVCERQWNDSGQCRGELYVLNAGPLPLPDTLMLDANYLNFLERTAGHYKRRVRSVARHVLTELGHSAR